MQSEVAAVCRIACTALITLVVGTLPLSAQTPVSEREPNNTWKGAQALAHGPDGVVVAAGPSSRKGDLDFYRFHARAGDVVTFDVDGAAGSGQSFDSFLVLLDETQAVLATNDDGGTLDPGSDMSIDAQLVHTFTADGIYTIVVTHCCDAVVLDGAQQLVGDYALTITGLAPLDLPDSDGDAFPDALDNCSAAANPTQADTDQDGIGDACNNAADADGDEWANALDNCPTVANPSQVDTDGDGIADACEARADILSLESIDRTRVKAEVDLLNPLGLDVSGEISVAPLARTLHRVTVSFFDTACEAADQYVVSLNGQVIGVDSSGNVDCTCTPSPRSVVFSGPAVAAAFNPDGENVVRVTRGMATAATGWIAATLEFGDGRDARACLFDADGGACTTTNMCTDGSDQTPGLDVAHAFGLDALVGTPLASIAYTHSELPTGLSFGSVPAGAYAVVTSAVGVAPPTIDALQLRFQNTTCSAVDTFTAFLNGQSVATAPGDPGFTCGCNAPILSLNVTDANALAAWTQNGPNVLRVTNTADANVQSSATSWVEATVVAGGRSKNVCLQGRCGLTDLCAGNATFNALDVSKRMDFDVAQVDVEPFHVTSQSELLINDQDDTPPVITPSITGTPGADGWYVSDVTVTWTVVDDESDVTSVGCEAVSVREDTAGTVLTCHALSGGGPASQSVIIKRDTRAPSIACSVTPSVLGPANHKMMTVTANVNASDPFTLLAVSSDEPDNGAGDGDTPNDIQGFEIGTADVTGALRAERAASGNGRTYRLVYQATDAAGNTTACTATAQVPRNVRR